MQAEKLVFQGKKTKKIHTQHKIGKSIMIDSGNMSANNTGVNSSNKTPSSLEIIPVVIHLNLKEFNRDYAGKRLKFLYKE